MKRVYQRVTGMVLILCMVLYASIPAFAEKETYLETAIHGLILYNILEGYGDREYGEDDYLTREQMAAFLSRVERLDDDSINLSFTDTDDISDWALNSVRGCVKNGIIDGYSDGSFRPQNWITTAEAVKMVVETIERTKNLRYPEGYMDYAENNGLLYNIDNNMNDFIKRGDVFKLIYTSYDQHRVIHLEDYITVRK